ncbi:hypothetical protein DOY81_010371 [Sarcophaga bullata]|nr:hypothetical protein DOY81_010371 [Sarcophaga bullata]
MNSLTSHIQDHSEGEAYACEFCDLIFMTAQKLQLHTDLDHAQEMEAYHADDRAQADKKNKESRKQEGEISDENLQNVVNEFLTNEYPDDAIDPLKTEIKIEKSPVIIKQVVIRGKSGTEQQEGSEIENQTDDSNSLLIPLKQRKIDDEGEKKAVVKSPQKLKQSPQLKRKTSNASSATPAKIAKQTTIQTLLKMPKGVTVTKSTIPRPARRYKNRCENKTQQLQLL